MFDGIKLGFTKMAAVAVVLTWLATAGSAKKEKACSMVVDRCTLCKNISANFQIGLQATDTIEVR